MPNPWREFEDHITGKIEDLGRDAIFLIPVHKLAWPYRSRGYRIEDDLHDFLSANFGSFTTELIPSFGLYRSKEGAMMYDECRKYEVAFVGKDRIPFLMNKLLDIARHIKEECIYFKAGEDACLIHPS